MRITQKGQVTIPIEMRERYGLLPDTEVEFLPDKDGVRIVRRSGQQSNRQAKLLRQLRGSATVRMSTDEIMALTRKK